MECGQNGQSKHDHVLYRTGGEKQGYTTQCEDSSKGQFMDLLTQSH